jgi:hypothetical protein
MRAAQRPRPRVKACRRASDRRVTPAGQHAAGIPGRSASQRPVSSWLLPGTSRGSDRRAADAHPLPSHARHRDDNDVGDRRSRDRPEARPARRGSHATVPHSRTTRHVGCCLMAPVGFCFDPDQSQSRSGSPVAGPATLQKRRAGTARLLSAFRSRSLTSPRASSRAFWNPSEQH